MKRRKFLKFCGIFPTIPLGFYLRPKRKKQIYWSEMQGRFCSISPKPKVTIDGGFEYPSNSLMKVGDKFIFHFDKRHFKVRLFGINLVIYNKDPRKLIYTNTYEGVEA